MNYTTSSHKLFLNTNRKVINFLTIHQIKSDITSRVWHKTDTHKISTSDQCFAKFCDNQIFL